MDGEELDSGHCFTSVEGDKLFVVASGKTSTESALLFGPDRSAAKEVPERESTSTFSVPAHDDISSARTKEQGLGNNPHVGRLEGSH